MVSLVLLIYDLEERLMEDNSTPIINIFEWLDQAVFIMLTKIAMTVLNG